MGFSPNKQTQYFTSRISFIIPYYLQNATRLLSGGPRRYSNRFPWSTENISKWFFGTPPTSLASQPQINFSDKKGCVVDQFSFGEKKDKTIHLHSGEKMREPVIVFIKSYLLLGWLSISLSCARFFIVPVRNWN